MTTENLTQKEMQTRVARHFEYNATETARVQFNGTDDLLFNKASGAVYWLEVIAPKEGDAVYMYRGQMQTHRKLFRFNGSAWVNQGVSSAIQ
jgi:hypothetical protein